MALKGEIYKSTIIIGDFNTIMDTIIRQEKGKEIEDLSNIIHQLDLTDIFRTPHLTTE